MPISNNHTSLHLWWKENLVKHQTVSKYFKSDCSTKTTILKKFEFHLNFFTLTLWTDNSLYFNISKFLPQPKSIYITFENSKWKGFLIKHEIFCSLIHSTYIFSKVITSWQLYSSIMFRAHYPCHKQLGMQMFLKNENLKL